MYVNVFVCMYARVRLLVVQCMVTDSRRTSVSLSPLVRGPVPIQVTYPRHCQVEHSVGELGEELSFVGVTQVRGLEASLLLDGGRDGLGETEMGGLLQGRPRGLCPERRLETNIVSLARVLHSAEGDAAGGVAVRRKHRAARGVWGQRSLVRQAGKPSGSTPHKNSPFSLLSGVPSRTTW